MTGRRLGSSASAGGLEGDRWIEWSFCMARLARGDGKTLDFGAGTGFLSLGAAQNGHHVVALDREPSSIRYSHERVELVRSDILDRPLADRHFDQVINCSSVEHVGLAGRYGSTGAPEGDIEAMAMYAGQGVGAIAAEEAAGEIVERFAYAALRR
jgi:SAM-dependent methyltransferase